MRMSWQILILSIATCVITAGTASAEGPYLGAGFGGARVTEDRVFFVGEATSAFKLYGGYSFNEHVALEAAYIDFDDMAEFIPITTQAQRAVADGHGGSLAGVAQFPIGRFAVLAKAGVFMWELDGEELDADVGSDGTDLLVGLGGRFQINDDIALQLDFERYEFDDLRARTALIGLNVRF